MTFLPVVAASGVALVASTGVLTVAARQVQVVPDHIDVQVTVTVEHEVSGSVDVKGSLDLDPILPADIRLHLPDPTLTVLVPPIHADGSLTVPPVRVSHEDGRP